MLSRLEGAMHVRAARWRVYSSDCTRQELESMQANYLARASLEVADGEGTWCRAVCAVLFVQQGAPQPPREPISSCRG
jgi:hypothetical protein